MNADRAGGVIPVPTWLLRDPELLDLIARIEEVARETEPDERDGECIGAMKAELARRGQPVQLIGGDA